MVYTMSMHGHGIYHVSMECLHGIYHFHAYIIYHFHGNIIYHFHAYIIYHFHAYIIYHVSMEREMVYTISMLTLYNFHGTWYIM